MPSSSWNWAVRSGQGYTRSGERYSIVLQNYCLQRKIIVEDHAVVTGSTSLDNTPTSLGPGPAWPNRAETALGQGRSRNLESNSHGTPPAQLTIGRTEEDISATQFKQTYKTSVSGSQTVRRY